MYCGHCAPCTIGIDVATVNKYLDLCLAENTVPDTVKDHYALLAHHAPDCVQCGICETNCPFGVTVAERMQRAAEIFGY
jgi:predicted aldo/keto reductase-like oxidoreductase